MPAIQDFKNLIKLNLTKDNKVATEDVNLAEIFYHSDIGTLKGESTRSKPVPVADNTVEVPDKLINSNKELKLSADRLSVNGLNFVVTIAYDLFHRSAGRVSD